MDEVGIEKAIILTRERGKAFDAIYERYSRYPDRIKVWCGLDYTGYDKPGFGAAAVRELERCYKLGARVVGELSDQGKGLFYSKPTKAWGMHLVDARMDPGLEIFAELEMPVNIHVADPRRMYKPMDASNDGLMNAYKWRLDNQPGIVVHEGMVEILGRAVKRHPRTIFLACHFANCSDDLDRLVYATDMRFGTEMYQHTFRILESADEHFYAWKRTSYHWPLYGLDLSDRILRKVYRENSLKLIRNKKFGSLDSGDKKGEPLRSRIVRPKVLR